MFLKIFLCAVLTAVINTRVVTPASVNYVSGIEKLSLNANRNELIWTAYAYNSLGSEIRVPATVPGGIYSDLEDNGMFANPIYHEYNDLDNRWVGRTNWTFIRGFSVSNRLLQKTKVVLVCEGLDTVGEVFINNVLVGRSENMFVRYVFDIKSALRVGQNTIKVAFRSPVEYAAEQFDEHVNQRGYPVVPASLVPEFKGENKAQMIRKMQSSFSWDWGPSYPNSGIWRNISIEGFSGAVIRDVLIFSTPTREVPDETHNTQWTITARVYYDAASSGPAILTFHRIGADCAPTQVYLVGGTGNSIDISIVESGANTDLWWPNGYGERTLYWYNVSLASYQKDETSTRLLRFGFRTVKLVQDFVDPENEDKGREFYFRVNGMKMYSKGSNAIPFHVLPERITAGQTEWVLRAAKMSHQNMMRVWGGGIYETEDFFDLADEYGILIWEDFMFACAMYPATARFLENVRHEVDTQIKRLQYRTSLAIWAGNNENEAALRGNWYGTWGRNFSLYKDDYVTLYITTIKNLTEKLDPSRQYLSSSPTNGVKTEEEGWVAENPYDLLYGDIHFYDYNNDNWQYGKFKRTRFASEYGYQSFPHYETLAKVADNITNWTWESPQMQHRQRHPRGQYEIRNIISQHFPFPRDYNSTAAFPYMLYMSQLSQIMGQKTQTEFYRRLQDKLSIDGSGHNMGAMYWQLNDIWEGCSWSSIEISGKWKLQMYYARKFFSPILASPYRVSNGDVLVELISDLPNKIILSPLYVKIYKMNSMIPVYEAANTSARTEFLKSPVAFQIENSVLQRLGCDGEPDTGTTDPCIVYVKYGNYSENFLFLQYPRNKLSLRDPYLSIEDVAGTRNGHTIHFRLNSYAIAPFVFLTVKGDHRGYFSDNGFIQFTPHKEMTYYSENGITRQQFLDRVEVMSLFNVTRVAASFQNRNAPRRRQLKAASVDVDSAESVDIVNLNDNSDENSVHHSYLLSDTFKSRVKHAITTWLERIF